MSLTKTLPPVLFAVGLAAGGCGLPEDQPTEPAPIPSGPATVTAPTGGTPGATPAPGLGSPSSAPTPEPEDSPDDPATDEPKDDPTPEPGSPPQGSGCGVPYPPEIARIALKVHLRGTGAWTLDSTPQVGPDAAYCKEIGFTDGRSFCPVRPEGHPEREACETWAVGFAVDTGRPGPTWRRNGSLCNGPPSCENHPDNQYFVRAIASGTYEACPRKGGCGTLDISR